MKDFCTPRRPVSLLRDGRQMWWLSCKVEWCNRRICRLHNKGIALTSPKIMALTKKLDDLTSQLGQTKGYFS